MDEALIDPVEDAQDAARAARSAAGAGSGPSDESQYVLHSRAEIVHVLRDVIRGRTLATVHFGGKDTLLTSLLAIDIAGERIVFDASGSDAVNRALEIAGRLLFFTSQDKVKVRFSTPRPLRIEHEGRTAFAAPLPETLLRLQRREFFRLPTPIARPVICVLPVEDDKGKRHLEVRLHDIGLGGIALVSAPGEIELAPGMQFRNCRIALPDIGNAVVTLEVRNTAEVTLVNGKTQLRAGCAFVSPSPAASGMVQRYLLALQRAMRSA